MDLPYNPHPVALWAEAHNIPTLKPEKITPEVIADIAQTPASVLLLRHMVRFFHKNSSTYHHTAHSMCTLPYYQNTEDQAHSKHRSSQEILKQVSPIIALDSEVNHGPILIQKKYLLQEMNSQGLGTTLFKKEVNFL